MANDLTLISSDVLTPEEADALEIAIQQTIERQRNNRTELNRLVFESIEAMTEAQDAQAALKNKTGLRRLIGSLTGSNKALQDKINENHAAMQYAGQQMLKALDEQNVMTFELITAVSNKLNAMQTETNEELTNIYEGLRKFVGVNQRNLRELVDRLEQTEQDVNLLGWGFSIKRRVLDGKKYVDLDGAGKIVCIARDFYDITKGNWSTSNLSVLQGTMDLVKLDPDATVNYFQILQGIGNSPMYLEKLFAGEEMHPIEDPSYLISMGTIGKIASLQGKESYIVDAVSSYLPIENTADKRNEIVGDLAKKYINGRTGVNVDTEIKTYDLMLDLLYSLKQVEAEGLLQGGQESESLQADVTNSIKRVESQNTEAVVQVAPPEEMFECEDNPDKIAEDLFLHFQLKEAARRFEKRAGQRDARAMYFLGEIDDWGTPHDTRIWPADNEWRYRGAKLGNRLCMLKLGGWENEEGVRASWNEIVSAVKQLADDSCDVFAMTEYASRYAIGEEKKAYLRKAVDGGWGIAMYLLGKIYLEGGDFRRAFGLYQMAAESGYGLAWLTLARSTDNPAEKMTFLQNAYDTNQSVVGKVAFDLGQMYEKFKYDDETAIRFYQKAGRYGIGDGWLQSVRLELRNRI